VPSARRRQRTRRRAGGYCYRSENKPCGGAGRLWLESRSVRKSTWWRSLRRRVPAVLLKLGHAEGGLEVLRLRSAVEPRGVVQNQARRDDAAGDGGLGADVDEIRRDQLTRAIAEDGDV